MRHLPGVRNDGHYHIRGEWDDGGVLARRVDGTRRLRRHPLRLNPVRVAPGERPYYSALRAPRYRPVNIGEAIEVAQFFAGSGADLAEFASLWRDLRPNLAVDEMIEMAVILLVP